MPCRSEYMEPTARETESRNVARLMLYVQRKRGKKIHYSFGEDELKSISQNIYGDPGAVDQLTADLCDTLRELEKNENEAYNQIMFEDRTRDSLLLYDWWAKHQEADRRRIAAEQRAEEERREREYAEYLRLKEKFENK